MATGNYRNATGTQQPPLFTSVDGTTQVGVLVRNDWGLTIFERSLSTGAITSSVDAQTIGTLTTNGITPIVSDALGGDVHFAPAIARDDQNRIHLVGNALASSTAGGTTGTTHYCRSAANSLSTWTALTWPFPGFPETSPGSGLSKTGSDQNTYNAFNRLSDGRLLWLIDQRDNGAPPPPEGKDNLMFILPLGSNNWSPLVDDGEFAISDVTPAPNRVYVNGMFVEQYPHTDRVWVWGVWRDDWTDVTTQKEPWIIYSDNCTDKTSWKRVDGTSQTMPVTHANIIGTNGTIPQVNGSYWFGSGQLVVDRTGKPHVITKAGATTANWHHYWDGAAWQEELCQTTAATPSPFTTRNGDTMLYRNFGNKLVNSKIVGTGNPNFTMGAADLDSAFTIPFADPIQLSAGYLHLMLPNGDTPEVVTFGMHTAATAS